MSKSKSRKNKTPSSIGDRAVLPGLTRRNFLKYSTGAVAGICLGSALARCGGGGGDPALQLPISVRPTQLSNRRSCLFR